MANSTGHKLAAILAADTVGHSGLNQVGEESTHRAFSAYIDTVTALIYRRNGKVMHFAGNAVLADEIIQ